MLPAGLRHYKSGKFEPEFVLKEYVMWKVHLFSRDILAVKTGCNTVKHERKSVNRFRICFKPMIFQ